MDVLDWFPPCQIRLTVNPSRVGIECRRQVKICRICRSFCKNIRNSSFYCHIWIQHEKYIQMSTNKTYIDPLVLEITITYVMGESIVDFKLLHVPKYYAVIVISITAPISTNMIIIDVYTGPLVIHVAISVVYVIDQPWGATRRWTLPS